MAFLDVDPLGYAIEQITLVILVLIYWILFVFQMKRHTLISNNIRRSSFRNTHSENTAKPHLIKINALKFFFMACILHTLVCIDPHGNRHIWSEKVATGLLHLTITVLFLFIFAYLNWHTRLSHRLIPPTVGDPADEREPLILPSVCIAFCALITASLIVIGAVMLCSQTEKAWNYLWCISGGLFGAISGFMIFNLNKYCVVESGFAKADKALPPPQTGGRRPSFIAQKSHNAAKHRVKRRLYKNRKRLNVVILLFVAFQSTLLYYYLVHVDPDMEILPVIEKDHKYPGSLPYDLPVLLTANVLTWIVLSLSWIGKEDERLYIAPAPDQRRRSFYDLVKERQQVVEEVTSVTWWSCGLCRGCGCEKHHIEDDQMVDGLPGLPRAPSPPREMRDMSGELTPPPGGGGGDVFGTRV